jgi:predicted MFS family arabinose efflux permease
MLALVLFLVQGLAQPAANPGVDQMLMEGVLPARRGVISSWRNIAADVSAIAGATIGGWLLEKGSFSVLFVTAGSVGLLAAVPLVARLYQLRRTQGVPS